MLLQSILYGSLRYWLFTCEPDEALLQRIEEDAKQLLWSINPELNQDELGTKKRSRRYIHEDASYLPQKEGGGGIMHLRSHIKAFLRVRRTQPFKHSGSSNMWIPDRRPGKT